jgi:hypothetical protein
MSCVSAAPMAILGRWASSSRMRKAHETSTISAAANIFRGLQDGGLKKLAKRRISVVIGSFTIQELSFNSFPVLLGRGAV